MDIIVYGNPVDGFEYYGPFENATDAINWARSSNLGGDWWYAKLEVPK